MGRHFQLLTKGMGKEDAGLSRRETKLRKRCAPSTKKLNLIHITHTLAQSVGGPEGPGVQTEVGDMLPNKVANLGDAVSLCQTPQQATAGVSMGGQNSG